MNELIEKFSKVVKGVLTGFDRMVFKGFDASDHVSARDVRLLPGKGHSE